MVEPRELVSSRLKLLGLFALALGFVAIAVFVPDDESDRTWRWLCGGFFGLGAIVAAVMMIRPQRVLLDSRGFTIVGGLARAPRQVAWTDVDSFFVYRVARGNRMIGYNLVERARPDTYGGDLARHLDADGAIPKTLPGSPEQIVAELNAYRAAALVR